MKESLREQSGMKLGSLYENGKGVAQSYIRAAEWYRKAAEQGDEDAQKRLREINRMKKPWRKFV